MSGSETEDIEEKRSEIRLFIGGLFPEVNDEELRSRFGRFGTVNGVEIKVRTDDNGNPNKTFAYIDLETSEKDFKKCVTTYNKTRWKGSELKIQVAKEDFLKRLVKERKEMSDGKIKKDIDAAPVSGIQGKLMAISDIATAANFNMRGATPGTTIPGQEKWIVGKYGRVLPIVHMKKCVTSKILKIDPSKLTHNVRRIKDEKYVDNISPSNLTWQLEEDDNEMNRKRKGEFPEWKPKVKRKRYINGECSQDNLQKRVMEVVESDKTYRNSDFEVVPVRGKSDNRSLDTSRKAFADLSRFDSDSEEDELNVGESASNNTDNIEDYFMDLSRFNSDSEVEMGNNSYQRAEYFRDSKNASNKSIEKTCAGKLNNSFSAFKTDTKVNQNSVKRLPPKQQNVNMLGSQNFIDEYSSGLSGLDKGNSVESKDNSGRASSDDDDDSDFEVYAQRQMKILESAKYDSNTSTKKYDSTDVCKKQSSLEKSNDSTVTKTELKRKVVDGKKTLLAFRGTKFLSADTQARTDSTVEHKSKVEKEETTVEGGKSVVKNYQDDSNNKNGRQTQILAKKQVEPVSFDKSSKMAVSGNFGRSKLLLDEFSSGLDMSDKNKSSDSSEDDEGDSDDVDSNFENFVKRETKKMELKAKSFDVGESSGHLKQTERNLDKSKKGTVEMKKNQYHSCSSSSESGDSDIGDETDTDDSEESVLVDNLINKTADETSPELKTLQDCVTKPDSDNSSDSEEENNENDEDVDDESESSSDFETLISKAVKEAQGFGSSNVNSKESSSISKASEGQDDIRDSNIKNETIRTPNAEKGSKDIDSSSESSYSDTDDDLEDSVLGHEEKEQVNSETNMLLANHNRNLDINSQFADNNDEHDGNDDDDDEQDEDGGVDDDDDDDDSDDDDDDSDDDGDDDDSTGDDDKVNGDDKNNKTLPRNKKNRTLDYSGVMSESSDSDNDTNMESENMESSDSDKNENLSGAFTYKNKKETSTNRNILKVVENKDGSKEIENHIESTTSSEGEKTNSSDAESDKSIKEETCKINLNPTKNKTTLPEVARVTSEGCVTTKSSPQSSVQLHGIEGVDVPSPVKKTSAHQNTIVKAKLQSLETKADVDKKRLEAVKQRQKEALAQKSLIKNALSNLDGNKAANTKIVFDSDSEEEHVAMETDEIANKTSKQKGNVTEELKSTTKSKTLFDSDDEEDDDDGNDDTRFNIRDEFEGAEGRKLARLQSRFGHDGRFKLDARFIESGSESDEEEREINLEDETTRSLKILQSVVGAKAVGAIHKHDKAKKKFKDIRALKYDPAQEEHQQFEVKMKPVEQPELVEKNKKRKRKTDIAMGKEPAIILPEVSKEKFYEISDSLKNTFAEKENTSTAATAGGSGFSLLAAFGRHNSDDDDDDKINDDEDSAIPIPETLRTNQLSLDNRFKVRDDVKHVESDRENHGEDSDKHQTDFVEKMDTAEKTVQQASDVKHSSSFFFMQNDERLKDPSKVTVNKAKEDWLGKRRHLIESYKSKHKNFRRKNVSTHKKRGGKRR